MTAIKRIVSLALLALISCSSAHFCFANEVVDLKRDRLIGFMLYKQLPAIHFGDKQFDDALSEAAFKLYLDQLDFQKRFLLQEDVDSLEKYKTMIDDNLKTGSITLPQLGHDILTRRIAEVQGIVNDLFKETFNVEKIESYETDQDKLGYVKDHAELQDRWRKIVKVQLISRYLDLLEEQQAKDKESGNKDALKANAAIDKKLWQTAREKVEQANHDLFARLNQETVQDFYDRYFDCIARAFDPHTNYMAPDTKEDFDIHMRGSLEGIGAMLREDDGYIKVVSIVPGSASARQGHLKAEDTILQVGEADQDPVEITNMRLRDAVRLIRGPKGSEVRLTVKKPDGKQEIIPIVRDVVQIEETFVKHTTMNLNGRKIGYMLIPSFYRDFDGTQNGAEARNATDDTRKALEALKEEGAEGLILDLRDNGGGSLVDAVDIAGLFIKSGPVVQVKNSFGSRKVLSDDDPAIVWDKPMVVLVNHFSASASEIVAAALQDYKRAVIMGGVHTHGKGTVQTVIDMNENIPVLQLHKFSDLGALKVTIQKFYRINGGSTQYKGVEPDIVLPTLYAYLKTGEKYLDNSLPWDQVEPVSYEPYTSGKFDLKTLEEKSRARIQKDKALQVIGEEAEKAKERSEKTIISIKYEDMEHEREITDAARDKVGAQYKKYEDEQKALDDPDTDAEKSDADWQKTVQEDPYVDEAAHVLGDMGISAH